MQLALVLQVWLYKLKQFVSSSCIVTSTNQTELAVIVPTGSHFMKMSQEESSAKTWPCKSCTFVNHEDMLTCEICDEPKDAEFFAKWKNCLRDKGSYHHSNNHDDDVDVKTNVDTNKANQHDDENSQNVDQSKIVSDQSNINTTIPELEPKEKVKSNMNNHESADKNDKNENDCNDNKTTAEIKDGDSNSNSNSNSSCNSVNDNNNHDSSCDLQSIELAQNLQAAFDAEFEFEKKQSQINSDSQFALRLSQGQAWFCESCFSLNMDINRTICSNCNVQRESFPKMPDTSSMSYITALELVDLMRDRLNNQIVNSNNNMTNGNNYNNSNINSNSNNNSNSNDNINSMYNAQAAAKNVVTVTRDECIVNLDMANRFITKLMSMLNVQSYYDYQANLSKNLSFGSSNNDNVNINNNNNNSNNNNNNNVKNKDNIIADLTNFTFNQSRRCTAVICYHWTPIGNHSNIVQKNLKVPDGREVKHQTDVGYYGKGIYMSADPFYARSYGRGTDKVLVCLTLPGYQWKSTYPNDFGKGLRHGYDSHVSWGQCGGGDRSYKEWVFFDSSQILPCYLISINDKTKLQFVQKRLQEIIDWLQIKNIELKENNDYNSNLNSNNKASNDKCNSNDDSAAQLNQQLNDFDSLDPPPKKRRRISKS